MSIQATERHMQAVHLYTVNESSWRDACKQAGFKRVPDINGDRVQKAFRLYAENTKTRSPNLDSAPDLETPHLVDPPKDADLEELERLTDADASWQQLAPLAKRVLGKIGLGSITATAQQVASLKEILTRAEGRAGQHLDTSEQDGNVVKLVVLPAIDTEAGPLIDLGEVAELDRGDAIPGLSIRHAVEK